MNSDKNEACARILGYEQIQSALYRFPTWRRGNEMIKLRAPDYDSDPALLGEMLAWFREHDLNIQLLYTVHGCKVDVLDWAYDLQHSHNGDTPNIAVRDALIAAGGEHE